MALCGFQLGVGQGVVGRGGSCSAPRRGPGRCHAGTSWRQEHSAQTAFGGLARAGGSRLRQAEAESDYSHHVTRRDAGTGWHPASGGPWAPPSASQAVTDN